MPAPDTSRKNGKAGGRPKGPSARTLAKQRGRAKALAQAEITAARTILEVGRVAFTDRRGVWNGGRLKALDDWSVDEGACLEGLEVIIKNAQAGDGHTDTIHKIKLTSKMGALEVLARHFGLLNDKLEVTAPAEIVAELLKARVARVDAPQT